jgi:hypothetical protein
MGLNWAQDLKRAVIRRLWLLLLLLSTHFTPNFARMIDEE